MSKTILFIAIIYLLSFSAISHKVWKASRCFLPTYHRGISHANPITVLWDATVDDCLRHCLIHSIQNDNVLCASIVYHKKFQTCSLYEHDGTRGISQIVYVEDHDYYNRTNYINECSDWEEIPPPSKNKYSVRSFPLNAFSELDGKTSELMNQSSEVLFDKNLANAECDAQEDVGYLLFHDFQAITTSVPIKLIGIDQLVCNTYCTQNIKADGGKFACFSTNYKKDSEECYLYGKDVQWKSSSTAIVKNGEFIFSNKICLQNRLKNSCITPLMFPTYPKMMSNMNIVDYSSSTTSIAHCLSICINDFYCQAITYRQGECVLHADNHNNGTELIMEEVHDSFVVENNCNKEYHHTSSIKNPEWSNWSECIYGVNGQTVRVRTRNCGPINCTDSQWQPCTEINQNL